MRYAIVDGKKSEAQPKLKGHCPNCDAEMVAKCGRVKIWHWAHKGCPPCDPWWETETNWHRAWKNCFPMDWQEVSHIDPYSGERHIADIKTPYGFVIEFQHSIIHHTERYEREAFYKNMIWVVDGLRNSFDLTYFNIGISGPVQNNPLAYKINWWGRSRLLHNWADSGAKVYLDFGGENLWRLIIFDSEKNVGAVGPISKEIFIQNCKNGEPISVSYIDEEEK
ncbi:hypothetical protein HL658_08770 [Azospirillum sp. RWY-5-1]|uniref:Competence protein CoiA-like N-terminal domain-containing protein n=1 Tax=Azospirillum oleiclasticum TaxID=2735135 RepID=A0ABX2T6I9_9PROT|nr:competence protein CoiA family protein [Azospirillum oleiclasticum]NYZ12641.1 hypothetical protein [Azospirillum oleiclasticum]NYZ19801.1 hypothetical protein [Azospirillum oleiclasticum]